MLKVSWRARARSESGTDEEIDEDTMAAPPEEFHDQSALVMAYPNHVTEATWWRYVMTVTGNAPQKDIAGTTGIDQSSISRWQRGTTTPRAEAVVALARAYGRSPVEALVAAGYLSSSEVGVVELTTLTGDLTGASIDSLLGEIRRRVLAANLDGTVQGWPAGWSSDDPGMGRRQDGEQTGDLNG